MENNMKIEYRTKARGLIVEYFKTHPDTRLTAKEIYDWLGDKIDGINRTTVYRNLDRMSDQGMLLKIKEPNSESWFYQFSEKHKSCNTHMHGQCSECGKIFHLDDKFVQEFEEKINFAYGLDVDAARTVIIGICKDCRDEKGQKDKS